MKKYNSLLWKIASKYIKKHNPVVIWITWSVGKTSSRMIITQILQKELKWWNIYTSPKNFNSELGLVFSIFKIEKYEPSIVTLLLILFKLVFKLIWDSKPYDAIVLEYGIDHKGDMDFLCNIVKPHYSVFTKLDKVHGEYFGSVDEIGDEKFKLMHSTINASFLNDDDDYARRNADALTSHKYFYFWETSGDLKPSFGNYQIVKVGNVIKAKYNLYLKENFSIRTNLLGKENASYIALSYRMASEIMNDYWMTDVSYKDRELDLELQPWRFTLFEGINDSVLVDSSYNASPLSMRKTIENVFNIKQSLLPDYKLILALGDMRELGDFSEDEHRYLAGIVSNVADSVVTVWKETRAYMKDELHKVWFEGWVYSYLNSKDAGKRIKDLLKDEKALVLFKWSQNTIFMEEALKFVLKNEEDKAKLCRGNKDWLNKKDKFFG